MRLAPAAIRHHGDRATAIEVARRQSATTHGAPQCLDACALFTELLLDAFDGVAKDRILTPREFDGHPAVASVAGGSYHDLSRHEVSSSGYVVHTLEAALWAFHKAGSFRQAVLLAANLADDADTVAAVTGQIAGAYWGCKGMPQAWRERIAWHDEIRDRASRLYQQGAPS